MGTELINGVSFRVYPNDHPPRHVHGFYGGIEAIVDLRLDGLIALADRRDAVRPGNGSRSDVSHILNMAANNFNTLVALWEKHHG